MAMFENLGGFLNSRPPLVVFMICLASFAIALITLAYVVKSKELPDPDIREDWNTMLEKFSHLHFCVPKTNSIQNNSTLPKLSAGEKSAAETYKNLHDTINSKVSETLGTSDAEDASNKESSQSSSMLTSGIRKRDVAAGLQYFKRDAADDDEASVSTSAYISDMPTSRKQTSASNKENVTVSLDFIYIPRFHTGKTALDSAHFSAAVTAHQMKLDVSAKVKGEESFNVFLNLPQNLTSSMCEEMEEGSCRQYSIPDCITFQGPSHLLPQTMRPNQEVCAAYSDPAQHGEYYQIQTGTLSEATQHDWCVGGSRLLPKYTLDDSLTVFLSMHDKSVINLHLMRTSYFLFVMVVTLFCYALIKGRPPKIKSPHISYDKVSSSA